MALSLLLGLAPVGCTADVFRSVWLTNNRSTPVVVIEEGILNRDDPVRVLTVEVIVPAGSTMGVVDNSAGEGSYLRLLDLECRLFERIALTDALWTSIIVSDEVEVLLNVHQIAPAFPTPQSRVCLREEYPAVTDFP